MSVYRIISAERASFPVSVMCEVLGVSRPGFHQWERRAPSDRALSDAWLTERIKDIHEHARGVYGSRRHTLGEDFLRSLEDYVELDDVAWACAMVACGLAEGFKELTVKRRMSGPDNRQLTRADDALGWRCTLTRKTTPVYIDFWTCPSGTIEFASFSDEECEWL